MHQNEPNYRLFLVISGKLQGYIPDTVPDGYPVFEATENKFVGVYSYFSHESKSYTEVRAAESSKVAYYDRGISDHTDKELLKLMPFMMSIVVNELSTRQQFARQMAKERHHHLQRLLQSEKMITLGQMAAGLAHELNNSIGVISSNLEQVEGFTANQLKNSRHPEFRAFFQLGLEKGQYLSSSEAREHRREIEKELRVTTNLARKLSKTGITTAQLKKAAGKKADLLEEIYEQWEAGCTLHDMQIASKQAGHVVKSVKQLGVAEHHWSADADINETIREALAIVKGLTKRVELEVELDELPTTEACPGELVQVWINLIKNAVESMIAAKSTAPRLEVFSKAGQDTLEIIIKDNGPGIPREIKNRIFEPSFTTKIGGLSFGLGLGLTIVNRIVTGHNGEIDVESEPGKTIFKVTLPIT